MGMGKTPAFRRKLKQIFCDLSTMKNRLYFFCLSFQMFANITGEHIWALGYFCRSSSQVTDAIIRAYIANQCHNYDATFSIEGDASPNGKFPLP